MPLMSLFNPPLLHKDLYLLRRLIVRFADKWELCAELANETWMPWGSTEVAVELAELRSIKSELQWSLRLAAFASAFWLLVLPAALTVRLAFIPSGSMEPTVHQGTHASRVQSVAVAMTSPHS